MRVSANVSVLAQQKEQQTCFRLGPHDTSVPSPTSFNFHTNPTSAAESLSRSFRRALAEAPLRHTAWPSLLLFMCGSIMSFAGARLTTLIFQAFPGFQWLVVFLSSVSINDSLLTEYRAQRPVRKKRPAIGQREFTNKAITHKLSEVQPPYLCLVQTTMAAVYMLQSGTGQAKVFIRLLDTIALWLVKIR